MKILYITITETFFRHIKPIVRALGTSLTDIDARVESRDCKERDEHWPALARIRNYPSAVSKTMSTVRNVRSYFHWISQKNQDWQFLGRYLIHHRLLLSRVFSIMHRTRLTRLVPAQQMVGIADKIEAGHAVHPAIIDDVKRVAPDVAIVCPLLYPNSSEADYVKACNELGIPTVALIASWDNLTSKNIFPVMPSYVFVWNNMQSEQLKRFHNIPEERIRIVGAQLFDYMFNSHAVLNRNQFSQEHSMDPGQRFLLWAASSRVAGVDEPKLLKKIIGKIRNSDLLKDLHVLIRPHPKYLKQWIGWNEPMTQIWRDSRFPEDPIACQGIQNSLHHSFAVIGLSTSLFFEAAIAGRPCAVFDQAQEIEGLMDPTYTRFIHYGYLKSGDVFQVLSTEDNCVEWLERLSRGVDDHREARLEFVKTFVRPCGLYRSAAECAAEELRKLGDETKRRTVH